MRSATTKSPCPCVCSSVAPAPCSWTRHASHDIDDRPLRKRNIVEVPTWRALVDPRGGGRVVGSNADLVGLVVGQPLAATTADDLRRHLWSMVTGDRSGWASVLDLLDDSQLVHSEDVTVGIRSLLAP